MSTTLCHPTHMIYTTFSHPILTSQRGCSSALLRRDFASWSQLKSYIHHSDTLLTSYIQHSHTLHSRRSAAQALQAAGVYRLLNSSRICTTLTPYSHDIYNILTSYSRRSAAAQAPPAGVISHFQVKSSRIYITLTPYSHHIYNILTPYSCRSAAAQAPQTVRVSHFQVAETPPSPAMGAGRHFQKSKCINRVAKTHRMP